MKRNRNVKLLWQVPLVVLLVVLTLGALYAAFLEPLLTLAFVPLVAVAFAAVAAINEAVEQSKFERDYD